MTRPTHGHAAARGRRLGGEGGDPPGHV